MSGGVTAVGVVGLGAMGRRVAGRLLACGHDVVVWNRDLAKAADLEAAGAAVAGSPAEVARRTGVVVVMVADGRALRAVTEGPDGLLAASAPVVLVQMSTVGPDDLDRLAAALPDGFAMLDAPVLGSLAEVEGGNLRVLAGGEPEAYARVLPVLRDLGTATRYGPLGAGTAAKLVANSALLSALVALGESLRLADALGLPTEAFFDVLAATPLAAQAERRRPAIDSEEFPARFALPLARKDAELIVAAARSQGADLPVAEAVRSWLADAERAGWAGYDYTALLAHVRGRAPGAG